MKRARVEEEEEEEVGYEQEREEEEEKTNKSLSAIGPRVDEKKKKKKKYPLSDEVYDLASEISKFIRAGNIMEHESIIPLRAQSEAEPVRFKVVVVGAKRSGKTSFINRLLTNGTCESAPLPINVTTTNKPFVIICDTSQCEDETRFHYTIDWMPYDCSDICKVSHTITAPSPVGMNYKEEMLVLYQTLEKEIRKIMELTAGQRGKIHLSGPFATLALRV